MKDEADFQPPAVLKIAAYYDEKSGRVGNVDIEVPRGEGFDPRYIEAVVACLFRPSWRTTAEVSDNLIHHLQNG